MAGPKITLYKFQVTNKLADQVDQVEMSPINREGKARGNYRSLSRLPKPPNLIGIDILLKLILRAAFLRGAVILFDGGEASGETISGEGVVRSGGSGLCALRGRKTPSLVVSFVAVEGGARLGVSELGA